LLIVILNFSFIIKVNFRIAAVFILKVVVILNVSVIVKVNFSISAVFTLSFVVTSHNV
jgi:hypothetical protein